MGATMGGTPLGEPDHRVATGFRGEDRGDVGNLISLDHEGGEELYIRGGGHNHLASTFVRRSMRAVVAVPE